MLLLKFSAVTSHWSLCEMTFRIKFKGIDEGQWALHSEEGCARRCFVALLALMLGSTGYFPTLTTLID